MPDTRTVCAITPAKGNGGGTSTACAFVTGAAALLLAVDPDLEAAELKALLLDNAHPITDLAGKSVSGGRLDLYAALLDAVGPWLTLADVGFVDDGTLGSRGNGNGIPEAGERIAVSYTLANVGSATATGIAIAAACDDPDITVVAAGGAAGDIADGATSAGPTVLIDIAPAKSPGEVTIAIEVSADGPRTWALEAPIEIHAVAAISGRVATLTGDLPIAGATVRCTGGPIDTEFTTAADGTYTGDLAIGDYQVAASAPGYVTSGAIAASLPPSATAVDFALGRPLLTTDPNSFAESLVWGSTAQRTLTLGNDGDVPLHLSLSPGDVAFANAGVEGRDGYGYAWQASNQPGGPAFAWEDISSVGTRLGISDRDGGSDWVDLPFAFPFYDRSLTRLRIFGDGVVSSGFSISNHNTALSSYSGVDVIAPMWDNYDASIAGEVHFHADQDRIIVQWAGIADDATEASRMTFQAALFPNGDIEYRYLSLAGPTDLCTVGITSGGHLQQVALNQPFVEDGMAIRFYRPRGWLSLEPTELVIAPGDSAEVTLSFDASPLQAGTASTDISITHDDPTTTDPALIPVVLTVTGEASLSLETASVDFGAVIRGLEAERNVVVFNGGPLAAELDQGGPMPPDVSFVGSLPLTVPALGRATFTLRYAPSSLGSMSDAIPLATTDPDLAAVGLPVSGEGIVGPIDGFLIDPIADPQAAGVAFDLGITAVDVAGNTVTDYAGSPSLTGIAFDPRSALKITQIDIGGPDEFELEHVGFEVLDTTGWRLAVGDDPSDIDLAVDTTWALPPSVAPGDLLVVDDDPDGGRYFGAELDLDPELGGWIMLVDENDIVIDAVYWRWPAEDIAACAPVVDGVTLDPAGRWRGSGLKPLAPWGGAYRTGDNEDAMGPVAWQYTDEGIGESNPGLNRRPMRTITFALVPASAGPFVDGRWDGSATVPHAVGRMSVQVLHSAYHHELSNPFSITGDPHLLVDASHLEFGVVTVNATESLSNPIRNPTGSDIVVDSVTFDDAAFAHSVPGPFTVPAYATLKSEIDFTPTTPGTRYDATMTLSSSGATPSTYIRTVGGDADPDPGYAEFLTLDPIADQVIDVPFDVTARATDLWGNPTDAGICVVLASTTIEYPGVYLSEVAVAPWRNFELHNVSAAPTDTTGWRLVVGDSLTTDTPATWDLPTSLAADEVLWIGDDPAATIDFGHDLGHVAWVALVDADGLLHDVLVLDSLPSSSIASAHPSLDGQDLELDRLWPMDGESSPSGGQSLIRSSNRTAPILGSWGNSGAPRFGLPNASLATVLNQRYPVPISPNVIGPLTGGSWTGSLTVGAVVDTLDLQIADIGGRPLISPVETFSVGTNRSIGFAPGTIDFGTVAVGGEAIATLLLSNHSDRRLAIDSLLCDDATVAAVLPVEAWIPPFGELEVPITWTPDSTGSLSADLTLASGSATPASSIIPVSGSAVQGDHTGFAWSAIPPQVAGADFEVTVTAIDAFGAPVSGYSGSPTLLASDGSWPLVLSQQIESPTPAVEIANVADRTLDFTGWTVVLSGSPIDINAVNPVSWTLSGALTQGAVEYRTGSVDDGANYWGGDIDWGDVSWAAILDPSGQLADIMLVGWGDPALSAFAPHHQLRNLSLSGRWTGSSYAGGGTSHQRTSGPSPSSSGHWAAFPAGPGDLGSPNAGLVTGNGIIPTGQAAIGPFTDGVWTGTVSVIDPASAIVLQALDSGAYGRSEPFFVAGSDHPPVIAQGDSIATNFPEDAPPANLATLTAADADGNTLDWAISRPPSIGTATISGSDGIPLRYIPPEHWYGDIDFDVTVSDGTGWSDTITVTVTVTPVNDHPEATDDQASTERDVPIEVAVLDNDTDVEGGLSIVLGDLPERGSVSIVDDRIRYEPAPGFIGVEHVGYFAHDGTEGDPAILTIVVRSPGDSIIRVDPTATGSASGASWVDALPSLVDAVAISGSGDELWVVGGLHLPGPIGDRSASFTITSDITIRGGFSGTENSPSERDPESPATILSGDLASDDDGSFGARSDNAHTVVSIGNAGDVLMERLVISGGDGGVAGGAIYAQDVDLRLELVDIRSNRSYRGAGVYAHGGTSLDLIDCTLQDNHTNHTTYSGGDGGAIYGSSVSDSLRARRCTFTANTALDRGGAIAFRGRRLTALDTVISRNTASEGGGVYLHGVEVEIQRTAFTSNSSDTRPGLSLYQSNVIADSCLVVDNQALGTTSALGMSDTSALLRSVTIAGNTSDGAGAAAIATDSESVLTLRNCLLWGNAADGDSGLTSQLQVLGDADVETCCIKAYDGSFGADAAIADDPQFVDPADADGPDDVLATRDDGYRLGAASPCRDAGDLFHAAPWDLTGYLRGFLTAPDLGCYDRGEQRREIVIRLLDTLLDAIPSDCELVVPAGEKVLEEDGATRFRKLDQVDHKVEIIAIPDGDG